MPVLDVNCTALYSANRCTIQSTIPDTSRRRWLGLVPAAAAVPLWRQTQGQTPPPGSGYRTHDILEYGAKGDGQTLDTAAVQRAIDACHRDRGGVVLVPAGDFLVGTLELKSNVTLHLSASGRVLGSGQAADYTAGKGVPPGNGNVVPLYAVDAENVSEGGPAKAHVLSQKAVSGELEQLRHFGDMAPSGKLRIFQDSSRDAGHVRGRQGFTDDPACAGRSSRAIGFGPISGC